MPYHPRKTTPPEPSSQVRASSSTPNSSNSHFILQVSHLQSQLDAQITRTSLLQKRLNDTLATLDALSQSHTEELTAVTRSEKRLRSKLNEYIQYAKDLEAERDNLRVEVTHLIQQGGQFRYSTHPVEDLGGCLCS